MKVLIYNDDSFINEEIHSYDRSIWIPKTVETSFILNRINLIFKDKSQDAAISIESSLSSPEINFNFQEIKKTNKRNHPDNNRIIFYTQSDTLSSSIIPIITKLNPDIPYQVLIPPVDKEHASKPLLENSIEFTELSKQSFLDFNPTLLFLLNDWSKIARGLIANARLKKIPSICLQESIISFGDRHARMERSDYVMIQGLQTLKHLEKKHYFLTGNPRYRPYDLNGKKGQYYLVNSNFTYNIEENNRYFWLDKVITSLEDNNLDYKIVQHPRDHGDLSNYKNVIRSSSTTINELMGKSIGVISRFSSLLHEAIINRIPAIYFNPHNESLHYDFQADDQVMFYCTEDHKLSEILQQLKITKDKSRFYNRYLINHCYNPNIDTPEVIASLIGHTVFKPQTAKLSDKVDAQKYSLPIRMVVDKLKSRFKNN